MAEIIAQKFEHRGQRYELSLHFDDGAMAEGAYALTAKVVREDANPPFRRMEISATATIQEDEHGRPVLEVKLAGDLDGREGDVTIYSKPLAELIDMEQVVDSIPAWVFGDPITGCLLRSGLSAIIGQTLECKKSTAESHWYWPRMRDLCRCMVRHVPEMTLTAATRAAKCVWRFGF